MTSLETRLPLRGFLITRHALLAETDSFHLAALLSDNNVRLRRVTRCALRLIKATHTSTLQTGIRTICHDQLAYYQRDSGSVAQPSSPLLSLSLSARQSTELTSFSGSVYPKPSSWRALLPLNSLQSRIGFFRSGRSLTGRGSKDRPCTLLGHALLLSDFFLNRFEAGMAHHQRQPPSP